MENVFIGVEITTNMKNTGPFRKCLADFIRKQRKYHSNKTIHDSMIYSFCQGWQALSGEMDKVFEKHNKEARKPL